MANAWSTGLYDCCDDVEICCFGLFCACAHGVLKEEATGAECCGATLAYFCAPMCTIAPELRLTIREKYQLPEEPCSGALQLLQIHEHTLVRMVHHSQKVLHWIGAASSICHICQ
jgi:Cys-rich protein (TIGR01571 family)